MVAIHAQTKPANRYREPTYVDLKRFSEVPITVGNDSFALPGTLSVPNTKTRVPAVVLLHGSGPNDRDETMGAHWPFRDLAWGLASQGIAVLRYDKRTLVFPKAFKGPAISVEDEVITDALTAIQILQKHPRIDAKQIFLIGHSLGGFLAPEIAIKADKLKGIGLLAANARPFDEVLRYQINFLKTLSDRPKEFDPILTVIDSITARTLPMARSVLGAPAGYYYALMDRDPIRIARALQIRLFVAGGGKDYQVTDEDYRIWKKELTGDNVTFRWYPEMNHLLLPSPGHSGPKDYQGEQRHVCPDLVQDLARWILKP